MIAGAQGAGSGQPKETREIPENQAGPQAKVPEHPEQMNEDVATEPTSRPEPRASPRAQTPVMDLGPYV